MVVLIIFHVILQTVINLIMLSIGGQYGPCLPTYHISPFVQSICYSKYTTNLSLQFILSKMVYAMAGLLCGV